MSTLEARLILLAIATLTLLGFGLLLAPGPLEETCRVVNVALGVIVAAGFYIRVNDMWPRYTLGARITRGGVLMLMLVAAGGSAEAYIDHAELGVRSVILTLALGVIGVGLLVLGRDHR